MSEEDRLSTGDADGRPVVDMRASGLAGLARRAALLRNGPRAREDARRRLLTIVKSKIQTTMIGAIAAVEDELGSLWGIRKHPDDLTEDEAALEVVFQGLRTRILNLGNAQRRAIESEFERYQVRAESPGDESEMRTINRKDG